MNLNLARKWRSRTFDQVVGQELNVRIIKNSLYLDYLFPVYLFAGQRGCGKTTMARIFASALNCQELSSFQKQPKAHSVPCLQCQSCSMMAQGIHPDFIEIDAASHTGVDNVRSIIDTATFMPIVGNKKIYLIDEAHMLSKAASNAFLKILEEPPAQVHFILATTEIHKIVDTIRSRTFQLFFGSIPLVALTHHLEEICNHENILYEQDGLQLIIQETDGSARDALNLLEQTRFASKRVTRNTVQEVLGYPDESLLISCMESILQSNASNALKILHEHIIIKASPLMVWRSFVHLVQALIALHCQQEPERFIHLKNQLNSLLSYCSLEHCADLLTNLAEYEQMLAKTTASYALLDLLIMRLSYRKNIQQSSSSSLAVAPKKMPLKALEHNSTQKNDDLSSTQQPTIIDSTKSNASQSDRWLLLMQHISQLNDPLLASIFKHVHTHTIQEDSQIMHITFAKEFNFFNDLLETTKKTWLSIVHTIFGSSFKVEVQFIEIKQSSAPIPKMVTSLPEPSRTKTLPPTAPIKTSTYSPKFTPKKSKSITTKSPSEESIDVSDPAEWPRAHALLSKFSGTITLITDQPPSAGTEKDI